MAENRTGTIRIGTGGWVYEPWRGSFYPKGLARDRELHFASRKLTSIEINSTYYGLKKPENFAKWYDETPPGFVFSLKAPRGVTDQRVLARAGESIDAFFKSGVMLLREKLGPINWQFAPFRRFNPVDFEEFLDLLPKNIDGQAIRHAVEVRHESFLNPEFLSLAARFGVAVVLAADSPYPQINDLTASFVYARIMGTRETEADGYPDADLDRWANRMRRWASGTPADLPAILPGPDVRQEGRDVFLYVIKGFKERNPRACAALIERVTGSRSA
ncbi:MAG TPA: DUF72 domain-containing protein [Desulfuromonadaceae bacterium]